MDKGTQVTDAGQQNIGVNSALEEVLRQGAREMLLRAIENEVAEYVDRHEELRDENGHRLVVRNGHSPERDILTGIGTIPVRQPRVNDKRPGEKFTSSILPPFMRRVPSIDALIPCLYLKAISTGDFGEALECKRRLKSAAGAGRKVRHVAESERTSLDCSPGIAENILCRPCRDVAAFVLTVTPICLIKPELLVLLLVQIVKAGKSNVGLSARSCRIARCSWSGHQAGQHHMLRSAEVSRLVVHGCMAASPQLKPMTIAGGEEGRNGGPGDDHHLSANRRAVNEADAGKAWRLCVGGVSEGRLPGRGRKALLR